jgi:transcriptional regulator with XRE-family HTH domain
VREDGDSGSFGDILRRYRWVAGLTQEELARQSGMSVRAVSDIERGHTSRPYARTVRLLADALKLDEPSRARLMSAVHNGTEEAADERQEWIARWEEAAARTAAAASDVDDADAVPAAQARDDTRSWLHARRPYWAHVAVASAAAALAGGLVGWAIMVNHAQMSSSAASMPQSSGLLEPMSDGSSGAVAQCDQGTADLTSSLVHGSNGAFLGTVEVRYSYRCAAVWTRFDPSPAILETKAVEVNLKIISRPDGSDQVTLASGTDDTNLLPVREGCAEGSVTLMKLGRELASVTTPCQAPP